MVLYNVHTRPTYIHVIHRSTHDKQQKNASNDYAQGGGYKYGGFRGSVGMGILWEFPQVFSVGMGWVWELKFNPHGSPA